VLERFRDRTEIHLGLPGEPADAMLNRLWPGHASFRIVNTAARAVLDDGELEQPTSEPEDQGEPKHYAPESLPAEPRPVPQSDAQSTDPVASRASRRFVNPTAAPSGFSGTERDPLNVPPALD
jgi:hypothetical protein